MNEKQTDQTIQELLSNCRQEIDLLDDQIVNLISKRFDVIHSVKKTKKKYNLPPRIQSRIDKVINRNVDTAKKLNIDPELIRQIYIKIIENSILLEEDYIKNKLEF